MTEKLYSTPKAADYLGRSLSGVKIIIKRGDLTGFKQSSRLRLFTQEELDEFAAKFPVVKLPNIKQLKTEIENSSVKEVAEKYGVVLNTIYRRTKKDA